LRWTLDSLTIFLKELWKRAYTGSVTIHFSQGGVAKVEKNETLTAYNKEKRATQSSKV